MANDNSIEQLYVEIGADASKLLVEAKKAVADTEKELEKIEKTGSKVFDEPTKKVKEFGKEAIGPIKQTEEEFQKLGDAGKKAFDDTGKAAKEFGDTFKRDVNGRLRDAQGRFVKFGEDGERIFDGPTKSAKGFGDYISGHLTKIVSGFIAAFAVERVVGFFKQIGQSAVQANSEFEVFTSQFETLLGSAGAAKERLDELAKFGVETPFELPEIVNASRVLQTFGGTALATGENLTLIGDIAAGVNQPFQDVAFWIGRMYSAMQAGQPFGEASARLQEMAAISGDTRLKLEQMQKAGASGAELFAVFTEETAQFSGGMERLSGTLQGIRSNLADFQGNLLRVGGEAYFEQTKDDAQRLLDLLNENAEPLTNLAQAIGEIAAQAKEFATSGLFDSLESIDAETIDNFAESLGRAGDALFEALDRADTSQDFSALLEILTAVIDVVTILTNVTNIFSEAEKNVADNTGIAGEALKTLFDTLGLLVDPTRLLTETWGRWNDILKETIGISIGEGLSDIAEATETEAQKNQKLIEAHLQLAEARQASAEAAKDSVEASKEVTDAFAKEREKAKELALEYADQVEKRDAALAENAEEHAANIAEIEQENAENIAEINEELADDLAEIEKESAKARQDAHDDYADGIADLEKEVAKKRRDILNSTKDELADLEAETDKALADEREDFQKDEKRETEDHLKEMRRLREDYLFNLEDAVGARDARAIVDLRRQYEQEKSQKEQDFQDNRSREKEDQDARLEQIREAEEEKAQALLEKQEEELLALQEYEEEKKQLAAEKLQEQLQQIDETEAEKTAKAEEAHAEALAKEQERFEEAQAAENERFDERNAKAQESLDKWLEDQAKALADSEEINKEGALKVFGALDSVFGLGGKIDNMLDAFEKRSKTRMTIEVGIEENFNTSSGSGSGNPFQPGGSGSGLGNQNTPNNPTASGFFAKGGRIIANKPTVAVFGEAGNEMATFEPLDGGIRPNLQTTMPMMGQNGQLDVNVRFEDLPPDYDQGKLENLVSTIFVDAINQAGFSNQ